MLYTVMVYLLGVAVCTAVSSPFQRWQLQLQFPEFWQPVDAGMHGQNDVVQSHN